LSGRATEHLGRTAASVPSGPIVPQADGRRYFAEVMEKRVRMNARGFGLSRCALELDDQIDRGDGVPRT